MTQDTQDQNGAAGSVSLSTSAAVQICKIVEHESAPKLLRVSVSGGGCSGFQYGFDLVEAQEDDDLLLERDGARVVIDSISLGFLEGSEIDYVNDLIGASFQIHNPQATSQCGCGTSFSI